MTYPFSDSRLPSLTLPLPRRHPSLPMKSDFTDGTLTLLSPASRGILDEIDQELQDTQEKLHCTVYEISNMTTGSKNKTFHKGGLQMLPLTPPADCTAIEFLTGEINSEASDGETKPALPLRNPLRNGYGISTPGSSAASSTPSSVYSQTYDGDPTDKSARDRKELERTVKRAGNHEDESPGFNSRALNFDLEQPSLSNKNAGRDQRTATDLVITQEGKPEADRNVSSNSCDPLPGLHNDIAFEDAKIEAWLARGLRDTPTRGESEPSSRSCEHKHYTSDRKHPALAQLDTRCGGHIFSSRPAIPLASPIQSRSSGRDAYWEWMSSDSSIHDTKANTDMETEDEPHSRSGVFGRSSYQSSSNPGSSIKSESEDSPELAARNMSNHAKRHDSLGSQPYDPRIENVDEKVTAEYQKHSRSPQSSPYPEFLSRHVHPKIPKHGIRPAHSNAPSSPRFMSRNNSQASASLYERRKGNLNKALPPLPISKQASESSIRAKSHNKHCEVEEYSPYHGSPTAKAKYGGQVPTTRALVDDTQVESPRRGTLTSQAKYAANGCKKFEVIGSRPARTSYTQQSEVASTKSPTRTTRPRSRSESQTTKPSKENKNSLELGLHMASKVVRRLRADYMDPKSATKPDSNMIPLPPVTLTHVKTAPIARTPKSEKFVPQTFSQRPNTSPPPSSPRSSPRTHPHEQEPDNKDSEGEFITIKINPSSFHKTVPSPYTPPTSPEHTSNSSSNTSSARLPTSSTTSSIPKSRFSFSSIESDEDEDDEKEKEGKQRHHHHHHHLHLHRRTASSSGAPSTSSVHRVL